MVKRIIFDVDNTLLEWKDEYIFALKNTLDKLNIDYTKEQLESIDNAIVDYEKTHNIYVAEDLQNFVNNVCQVNVPDEFMNTLIEEQGNCYTYDAKLVDTIKYLNEKYDLVVLSNWFTKTQRLRLQKMDILKYFSFVTGGDEHVLKPNRRAFDKVLEGYEPSECIMVGDSFNHDIMPASELGIKAIWVTDEESSDYQTIKSIYELKDIL